MRTYSTGLLAHALSALPFIWIFGALLLALGVGYLAGTERADDRADGTDGEDVADLAGLELEMS